MGDLWNRFVPDMSGDIKEQQLKVCAQIVLMESERYNEQVKMLKRVRRSSDGLAKLDQVRGAYGNDPPLAHITDSKKYISRFAARGSMDKDYFHTAKFTYDEFLPSLLSYQHDHAQYSISS